MTARIPGTDPEHRDTDENGTDVSVLASATYNAGGQVTDIFDRAEADAFFDNQRLAAHQHFVYDAWSRLIEASGREHESVSSGPLHHAPVQVLDPDSNRLTGTSASASALEDADGVAWLVPDSASTSRDGYVHDDAGNLLGMPHLHALSWDAFDRLRTVQKTWSDATDRWFYVYDAAGERVRKVRVVGGDVVEERRYVGSFEVHRLFDSLGDVEDEVETVHVLADDGRVAMLETRTVDGGSAPVALDAVWRFQLSNALGSACVEVTETGEVLSYEELYPYGASSYWGEPSGSAVSRKRYRFTGMERDEETGLQRHGLRYYAPWLGRWASADPIGVAGGVNLFEYCSGNPLGATDPRGTFDECVDSPIAQHSMTDVELDPNTSFYGSETTEVAADGTNLSQSFDAESTVPASELPPDDPAATESAAVVDGQRVEIPSGYDEVIARMGDGSSFSILDAKGYYQPFIETDPIFDNCFDCAKETLRKMKSVVVGRDGNVIRLGPDDRLWKGEVFGLSDRNFNAAVSSLDSQLARGSPVLIGVDYRPAGDEPINEGVTDHFLVVVGRAWDPESNEMRYVAIDNAAGSLNDVYRVRFFSIDRDNGLILSLPREEDKDFAVGRTYIISQVRAP